MALTPEGRVKRGIKAILKARGIWFFMPQNMGLGSSGVFDIVCCVCGWFVGIECKASPKNKPTALQNICARAVHAAGGIVFLIHSDNMSELAQILDKIIRGEYEPSKDGRSFWAPEGFTESGE